MTAPPEFSADSWHLHRRCSSCSCFAEVLGLGTVHSRRPNPTVDLSLEDTNSHLLSCAGLVSRQVPDLFLLLSSVGSPVRIKKRQTTTLVLSVLFSTILYCHRHRYCSCLQAKDLSATAVRQKWRQRASEDRSNRFLTDCLA